MKPRNWDCWYLLKLSGNWVGGRSMASRILLRLDEYSTLGLTVKASGQ
jgi:hypothetical protein